MFLSPVAVQHTSATHLETLAALGFTYRGREANAPWRAAADARIDRYRKADLKVRVLNAQGQPESGAAVRLQMRQHAFKFSSEIAVERLFADKTYQAKALELYNQVVLGNALKWPVWEQPWYPKSLTPQALKLFRDHGIPVRGHNLIWPCDDSYCLPDDVPGLFGNPAALRARIDAHLKDILGATKGQLTEWDVVNEPSANKRLARLLGEDEIAVWLNRAKQLDPSAKMFLNDYGNLGEGGLDTEYKRIIARMQALKAPLEGIGLQGHFGWSMTPPDELYARLNSFASFGLPLEITEFDVNITDEQLQADYLKDAMTVAFSQPAVTGFMMWGFWQDQHWLPDAALYRTDWSIKPNGQVWLDLVKNRWWTDVRGSSTNSGQFAARGFLGDYLLTATLGQKTVSLPVTLNRASGEFTLRLP